MIERVAIVSLAGRFPGAGADLGRFWGRIVGAVDGSRAVPPDRWRLPPERCSDPRIANPDTVYSERGYYLDPFAPDLTGLDLDPDLVGALDPLFHLVLDVGNRAWRGAQTGAVDRGRVGVVLGNICLPTDSANAICRSVLGAKVGLPPEPPPHPLNRYVAGLPAGLLAKGLKLGGGSFTLDAACASSLYAIKLACDELLAGRADAMLAGGASRPDCQYTQMGFSQLRALAPSGRCAPFDARADGLVVGEGAGVFVLKRLTDALKHGDTVHAVVAGVGLSNDMHGNLLAPAKEGQLRAMRAAYARAGWEPRDADLIECHATGTPVGDAVEFDSLRELWGDSGWEPGRCAIGSVKSTVGHLLTGAGAAALTKVLLAIKAETLPPQANFAEAAPGLRYAGGPFRVLTRPEPWNRRGPLDPRRAAVSGFGFGGVNAHLLIEEWTGVPQKPAPRAGTGPVPKLATPEQVWGAPLAREPGGADAIAVVGVAAHVGPWADARALQEHLLSGEAARPVPKTNGWALAHAPCPPGFYIDELKLPIDRFRIPPKEIAETLPQQLLALQVAAAALDDAGRAAPGNAAEGDAPTTGVFLGLGLDPNTTNFHLRWSAIAAGADPVAAGPPLTANRTMGALGSIAASRVARAFHFGGPSHTVCSEDGSGARAVELGVRALRAHELDRVLVGGVDLAGDPRLVLPGAERLPGEGAVVLVLKRLADAESAGDRVYAVVRGVGVAGDPKAALKRAAADASAAVASAAPFEAASDVGAAGAASGAVSLLKACLALYQEVLPGDAPHYWLHNRADGPRRATVSAGGADGSHFAFVLEEYGAHTTARTPDREQPIGARDEAVFVVSGDTPDDLRTGLSALGTFAGTRRARPIEAAARAWFRATPPSGAHRLAVGCVARSADELAEQLAFAKESLAAGPDAPLPASAKPALRDRVFYAPKPLGPKAKVAFVFPGSGNQFDGMGRDLSPHWPEVFRRQHAENERLRDQFAPHLFWTGRTSDATARDLMFGQVTVGALVADVAAALGVRADAMIGLSLGESAGLFGVRAWRSRDEMYRRMKASTLFVSDLAPPYDAARTHWETPPGTPVDWATGIVAAAPDDVAAALRPGLLAYLLIVNTPTECVIGGRRADVEKLAAAVNKPLHLLDGVTLAHCEAGRPVEGPYRELHTLPVTPPARATIYSGAWGKSYRPSEKLCADSITAGLVGPIDVPRVIESAYRDGVRAFVEVGPGNSCTRMIGAILGDRRHFARAAHAARQDAVSQVLRLVAHLAAERLPVDLAALYGTETACVGHRERGGTRRPEIAIPVGARPVVREIPVIAQPARGVRVDGPVVRDQPPAQVPSAHAEAAAPVTAAVSEALSAAIAPLIESAANVQVLNAQAQEAFLRINSKLMESAAGVLRFQTALLETWVRGGGMTLPVVREEPNPPTPFPKREGGAREPSVVWSPSPRSGPREAPLTGPESKGGGVGEGSSSSSPSLQGGGWGVGSSSSSPPRSLTYEQCCEFAAGKIANALGPLFAEVDTFPTRVRLPDGPLQLVDRITLIEGEPRSMTSGRVVTEHTVHADRWYLEAGRIPTAICVESGQADLFLSGYLGIDFQTRGLAVYRLLDAVVSFHRGLPAVGETVVYDIHIDRFVQQAGSWLFHFWFDGTVNGEPLITMRNGVAGFFTAEALAAGKGIVQTTLDKQHRPGKRAEGCDFVPWRPCSLTADQVTALRAGDLATAFGPEFVNANLKHPATIPGGMLRLVDRVSLIEPQGGRFGTGFVRAEFDIRPDDWFITCHFVDDQVMPGTLMYECCLHTLRVLLMRMGWVGEHAEVVHEPMPGVNSRLKCRGQVLPTTKTVTYEVTVKELGFRPEPYCLADALMYADGKPIVEITNMSLRMSGLSRERLEAVWARRGPTPSPSLKGGEQERQPTPNPSTSSPALSAELLAGRGKGGEPDLRTRKAFGESEEASRAFTPSLQGGGRGVGSSPPLYDSARIMAYSNGKPSEAFGEPYHIFDSERVLARLPGPPFQFLDCITAVAGEPFVLKAGAACEALYAVPPDAWYFGANRCEKMPFAVLLEIALQPCGWLAAYCGSALTSKEDLSFRNLGGKATQFRPVTPGTGTLTINVKMTSVSNSAGMIIQHYDMLVRDRDGDVYKGTTYFGFFTKPALANQIGIRDAKVPWPNEQELARAQSGVLPHTAPFPAPMMRMVDRVTAYIPDGGSKGLGLVVGTIAVDPEFWFFKAHFYQDPVWPGSLGLESFLQLLKYAAWRRWGDGGKSWQTVAVNRPHSWVYRGQVLPTDHEVTVVLEIVAADAHNQRLSANGFLTVDGRVIYQMIDFSLE